MNFLKKIAEHIAGLMVLVGFFLLVGTAGASDYADEAGLVFQYSDYIPFIVGGLVLIFAGEFIVKGLERVGWYEEGGDEDGTDW